FDADVYFVGPGAARKTLMLAAASDSRTVAPSRNPNRFFMKTSPWHRKCFQTHRPAFIRCHRENARPARTCTEFMIIANACERSLRLIRIELKLASSVRASVCVPERTLFYCDILVKDSTSIYVHS